MTAHSDVGGFAESLHGQKQHLAELEAEMADSKGDFEAMERTANSLSNDLTGAVERIEELEALNAEQSEHTSKLGKENLELRQALRYLADEGNYDKHEEDEDYYRLVRPGGARKEGIFSLSRHLCAWVYAEAVGDEWQALQDHERIERLVLAENKDDRED